MVARRVAVPFLLLVALYAGSERRLGQDSLANRRLAIRRARNEIDFPGGNQRHVRLERWKVEEAHAREELARLEYLQEKKLPALIKQATRDGNSKKDRAKLAKVEKQYAEIEHAKMRERREQRLNRLDRHSHGIGAFFPEIELDQDQREHLSSLRGIRGKGRSNHKRAENRMNKFKRKKAFEDLQLKEIDADTRSRAKGGGGGGGGGRINGTLSKYAKSYRKKARLKQLARLEAETDAAEHSTEVVARRQRSEALERLSERRSRAKHLEEDLFLEQQLEDGRSSGGGSPGHSGEAARILAWIAKLSDGARAAWGEPLLTIHIMVADTAAARFEALNSSPEDNASESSRRSLNDEDPAALEHEAKRAAASAAEAQALVVEDIDGTPIDPQAAAAAEAAALAASEAAARATGARRRRAMRWAASERRLRAVLASLATTSSSTYLGDSVDLHIHLRLDMDDGKSEGRGDGSSEVGKWGLTNLGLPGNDRSSSSSSSSLSSSFASPLPSQAGTLALAESFVWPFGIKNVTVTWNNPPQGRRRRRLGVDSAYPLSRRLDEDGFDETGAEGYDDDKPVEGAPDGEDNETTEYGDSIEDDDEMEAEDWVSQDMHWFLNTWNPVLPLLEGGLFIDLTTTGRSAGPDGSGYIFLGHAMYAYLKASMLVFRHDSSNVDEAARKKVFGVALECKPPHAIDSPASGSTATLKEVEDGKTGKASKRLPLSYFLSSGDGERDGNHDFFQSPLLIFGGAFLHLRRYALLRLELRNAVSVNFVHHQAHTEEAQLTWQGMLAEIATATDASVLCPIADPPFSTIANTTSSSISDRSTKQVLRRWPGREVFKGDAPILPSLTSLERFDAFGVKIPESKTSAKDDRAFVEWVAAASATFVPRNLPSEGVPECGIVSRHDEAAAGNSSYISSNGKKELAMGFIETAACLQRMVDKRRSGANATNSNT